MTTIESNYEMRIQAAAEIYMEANGREPLDNDWGLLVQDDNSFPLAATFRFFAWFGTRDQLIDFMAHHLILSASEPPGEAEVDAIVAKFAGLVDQVRQSTLPIRDLITASADRLASSQTLEWVGTFADLCTSADDAAKQVRAEFWDAEDAEDAGDSAAASPVGAEDRAKFVDFLASYGV
jgi:hypothetical protein